MNTHDFSEVPVATGLWRRMIGLIGQTDPSRLFLLIPRCSAIHTCGIRSAIDVVFLAADGTVVAIHPSVPPWRIRLGPRSAASTLELPPRHAADACVAVGDVVKLSPTWSTPTSR